MKTIIYDKRSNKYYRPIAYRYPEMGEYYISISGFTVKRVSTHVTNGPRLILREVTRKVTTEFEDIQTIQEQYYNPISKARPWIA